jgi:serine O-acetyltransferase
MKYEGAYVTEWAGESQWRAWRAEYARFRENGYTAWVSEGFWALTIYRLQKAVQRRPHSVPWAPLRTMLKVLRKLVVLATMIDIHPDAEIGPGLIIPHGGPIRVHGGAKIGADCALHHMCTIGAGPRPGAAQIGDHVFIGCHATTVGPVRIGAGAMIAANSLVICDIPPGVTAIGVPAKILPEMPRGWRMPEATSASASGRNRSIESPPDWRRSA